MTITQQQGQVNSKQPNTLKNVQNNIQDSVQYNPFLISIPLNEQLGECTLLVVVWSRLEVDFTWGATALWIVLMLCYVITLSLSYFSPSCDSNLRLISRSGSSERDSSKACRGAKPFREKGTVHKHTMSVFLHGKMLHTDCLFVVWNWTMRSKRLRL